MWGRARGRQHKVDFEKSQDLISVGCYRLRRPISLKAPGKPASGTRSRPKQEGYRADARRHHNHSLAWANKWTLRQPRFSRRTQPLEARRPPAKTFRAAHVIWSNFKYLSLDPLSTKSTRSSLHQIQTTGRQKLLPIWACFSARYTCHLSIQELCRAPTHFTTGKYSHLQRRATKCRVTFYCSAVQPRSWRTGQCRTSTCEAKRRSIRLAVPCCSGPNPALAGMTRVRKGQIITISSARIRTRESLTDTNSRARRSISGNLRGTLSTISVKRRAEISPQAETGRSWPPPRQEIVISSSVSLIRRRISSDLRCTHSNQAEAQIGCPDHFDSLKIIAINCLGIEPRRPCRISTSCTQRLAAPLPILQLWFPLYLDQVRNSAGQARREKQVDIKILRRY